MRTAVVGVGTFLTIFFMFIAMSTLARGSLMYQEAYTACSEAEYNSCLMLLEEEDAIESDGDFEAAFMAFARPLLSHPENYRILIHKANYSKGVIDAEISYSWMPWINGHDSGSEHFNEIKTISVRRRMNADEVY